MFINFLNKWQLTSPDHSFCFDNLLNTSILWNNSMKCHCHVQETMIFLDRSTLKNNAILYYLTRPPILFKQLLEEHKSLLQLNRLCLLINPDRLLVWCNTRRHQSHNLTPTPPLSSVSWLSTRGLSFRKLFEFLGIGLPLYRERFSVLFNCISIRSSAVFSVKDDQVNLLCLL